VRVAIVTTAGVTRQFRQWPEAILGRALVARGHQVAAFTIREEGSDITGAEREDVDGIAVRRLKVNRAWMAPGLLPSLVSFRPHVVHLFHLRNALNWQATLWARLAGVPVVFTVVGPFHDPYLVDDRERPYAGRMYPRRLIYTAGQLALRLVKSRFRKPLSTWQNWCMHYPLKAADRLIALSRHEVGVLERITTKDEGRRTKGESHYTIQKTQHATRIRRIPLWIDLPYIRAVPYAPSPAADYPSPHVLFLGQLKERKGYDILAEAMPLVLAECPAATFLFAGQNPARATHLREICARNGTTGHMVLLGKVSEEDKVRLMRSADCLVYPTRYESFGLPPLEAMAAGCVVVASDIPVVSEMIQDGVNGALVEPEDPAALAHGIVRVLKDPALRSALIAGGYRTLSRYSEEAIVGEIVALYNEVL
jgi:glycosyltransferase involved in cell wall biosynthesis